MITKLKDFFRKILIGWATLIGLAAAAGALGILFYGFTGWFWSIVFLPIAFPLVMFTCTVIHEAGHVAGDMVAKWRPIVVAAWPFAYHLPNNAIVLFGKGGSFDGGGYVLSVPRQAHHNTRLRYAVTVAGGPLFSLLAGVALLVLAASIPTNAFERRPRAPPVESTAHLPIVHQPWKSAPSELNVRHLTVIDISDDIDLYRPITAILSAIGFLSIAAFVVTMTPYRVDSGNATDGRKLLALLSMRSAEPYSPARHAQTLLHYNVRLRDLPDWMLETSPDELARRGEELSWHDGVAIGRTLDAEIVDKAKARAQIDAYRTTYGDSDWLASVDAYTIAVHEDDGERAATRLANLTGENREAAMLSAAEAAIAARNGNANLLARKLDEMEAHLLRDTPFPNPTFTDIRRQIEAVARQRAAA